MSFVKKPTLVLGASTNPARYSHLAMERLVAHGHPVIAIGLREGMVAGISILKDIPSHAVVDTITLYLNPRRQEMYYESILKLQPHRIIFNPGTENDTLKEMAEAAGIETVEACTLVMLASGQY